MKTLKNTALLIVGLLFCLSCTEDVFETNPFLGSWYCQESSYSDGITVYSDYEITFFEDMTYVVNAKYYTQNNSQSKVVTGTYSYDDEKIWLDDKGQLFGTGGYCSYSIYKDVLKLVWSNATKVFYRR